MQRFTSKHDQPCAYKAGKPDSIQMELSQLQPHFSPMSCNGRQTLMQLEHRVQGE